MLLSYRDCLVVLLHCNHLSIVLEVMNCAHVPPRIQSNLCQINSHVPHPRNIAKICLFMALLRKTWPFLIVKKNTQNVSNSVFPPRSEPLCLRQDESTLCVY